MQFDYNDPIITKRRKGTSDDPFIDCNETHVVENGKVILTEIPDPFTRVIVTGANKQWYEIQSGIPKDNEYLVDYKNKIVTFNTVNNGLQLNFSYKGTGLTYVPTSMIYTKQNNGEIVETLKQLTDSTEQARDSANEAADNLVHKGVYDNETQYKQRNIVIYQGSTYMAIADTQGNPPTDENYWKKLTAFSWKGIYDSKVTYNTGDFVQDVDQRNLYLSLIDSNTGNDLTDITKWRKLITIDDIVNTANQAIADANIATTNANNAADNANTEATNAQNQANYAKTQGDYAKAQGDYAKAQGDAANLATTNANNAATVANDAANNANNAADNANTAATNANNAATAANNATTNANTAADNANTQATNAQNAAQSANDAATNANNAADNANTQAAYAQIQGDYAKAQGDYAKQVGDENKTRWLTAVNTYADIAATYPNPQLGDTVQTIDDSKIYRWDGTQWVWTQQYNANAITDVQNKIGILNNSLLKVSDENKTIKTNYESKCLVSFVTDDGRLEDYTIFWKKIFEPEGVNFSVPVITSKISNDPLFMTWEMAKELKMKGNIVCSHGHNHIHMNQSSEEVVDEDMRMAKELLKQHGLHHDIFVFPYGDDDEKSRRIAKKYYKCAVDTHYTHQDGSTNNIKPVQKIPFSNYKIKRRKCLGETNFDGTPVTLEQCKADVDYALENGLWLVFMSHAHYDWFKDDANVQTFRELIQYIKSRGIEIVTLEEGLIRKGNSLEIGDPSSGGKWLVVQNDGQIFTNTLKYENRVKTPTTSNLYKNKWTKICSVTIDGAYKFFVTEAKYRFIGTSLLANTQTRGKLTIRISTAQTMPSTPTVELKLFKEMENHIDFVLSPNDIVAVSNVNGNTTQVDLYVRLTQDYRKLLFEFEREYCDTTNYRVDFYDESSWEDQLPSGTNHNCLLDVQKGTFAPVFGGSITDGTHTYTRQDGFYHVVNNVVYFTIQLTGTFDNTIDGDLLIKNLPFTTNTYVYGVVVPYVSDFETNNIPIGGYIDRTTNRIVLQKRNSTTGLTMNIPARQVRGYSFNIIATGFYEIQ